jgi:hypothetical protein
VIVSASSSQLAPIAGGAGKVILVASIHKIVADYEDALRRVEDTVFPYEDARVRAVLNTGTFIGKILIVRREYIDHRITLVLVRESIGV